MNRYDKKYLLEYTAQERAGLIAWQLAVGQKLTIQDVMRLTGLSHRGAWHLITGLSRKLPIYCNDLGEWCKVEERISC